MRILFNVAHPAQVHLFRNALQTLMDHGHECRITAINKEVSLKLLDSFGFGFDPIGMYRLPVQDGFHKNLVPLKMRGFESLA